VKRSEALTLAFLPRLTIGLYASLADFKFLSPMPFAIQLARTNDLRLLSVKFFGLNLVMSEKVLEKELEEEADLSDESESELELEPVLRERLDLRCLDMLAMQEQKKI
jgi:hypothetical protein